MLNFIVNSLFSLLVFTSMAHATKHSRFELDNNARKQTKITHYFTSSSIAIESHVPPLSKIEAAISTVGAKRSIPLPAIESMPLTKIVKINEQPPSQLGKPENPSPALGQVSKISKAVPKINIDFLHGTDNHINAYSDLIDEAEEEIIIASWNLNFIPKPIFLSLMAAKKKGVCITFVVNSIKSDTALSCFEEEDEEESTMFQIFETKSHAKFLFVDKTALILGSYNALEESFDETDDASFMLKGSIKQLWPFYMSFYESYIALGEEELGNIFCLTAMISKIRNPKDRRLYQQFFEDGSKLSLLRTIKEHEDFFRMAPETNGSVTIYSPFSTKENALKRLQTLERILHKEPKVTLKVFKRYEQGLINLLNLFPYLKNRTLIKTTTSHQKTVIIGDQTICVGSLNWLSAAQSADNPYSNVEFSIVLQGLQAEKLIKKYY